MNNKFKEMKNKKNSELKEFTILALNNLHFIFF
jgi:hypothetical protein